VREVEGDLVFFFQDSERDSAPWHLLERRTRCFGHATGSSGGAGAVSVDDELPMDIAICAGDDGLARLLLGGRLEGSDSRLRSIVCDCALRRTTKMSLAERR
jgi:hypothetical protein